MLSTNRFLLDHGFDNSDQVDGENCAIVPPVYVDPSAEIERSVIGPYATVAAGCRIKDAIVRDSIIDERAQVESALLRNSLVGQDASVRGRFSSHNVGDTSVLGTYLDN